LAVQTTQSVGIHGNVGKNYLENIILILSFVSSLKQGNMIMDKAAEWLLGLMLKE
jgi:hypothetical protein